MSVQAYILIQSEIGSSEAVVLATRAVPGVVEAFEVTGPYDVIVRCGADSVDDLGKFIVGAIQKEGKFDFQGFGVFKKVQQAAVSRPSPQDRTKMIHTPARNTVKFKASPALKALVK